MHTKNYLHFTAYVLLLVLIISCNEEDDTESIFSNRTWYISGVQINGKSINGEEIKSLYKSSNSYYIHFNSDMTFTGKLSSLSSLSGSWKVENTKRKFSLMITANENISSTTLDQNIYSILQNIRLYSGDTNNMCLKKDNRNTINFTSNKTTNSL